MLCNDLSNGKMDTISQKEDGVIMDWIHLAKDRDQWRVLGNTVMNLRVP
jgi:hypothetical protein